ncbi:MAG: hypothetical protein A3I72_05140 [Candidatus Tectomicrobia bacterium RIFCSPLOWO2_02_FULL_70_19]|nr:MAG: hypothetical protein A3I72_05140 [Candidatus Tectomicrobia bacterium RIFCSPLOWO2_02_FULL_70_19]
MPGPRGSLRWKLTLVHWAVIALVLAAGMLYLHVSLSRQLVALAEEGLARDARLALHHLLEAARRGPADADALAHEIGRALGMRVTIIAAGGRLLGDSGLAAQDLERAENHAARPEVVAALRLGMGKDTRRSATVGHPLLYLALPIREGPFAGGVLRLARDLGEVEGTLARMRGILYAGGGLAFLLALGISLGAGEVARRAIGEILRTVEAIIGGDFARRIGSARRDELGDLFRALDALSAHVEARLAELRLERDRLEGILSGMAEGVMVTDGEGSILLVNPALRGFFPSLPELLPGGSVPLEVLRAPGVQEAVRQAIEGRDARLAREVEILGPPQRVLALSAGRHGEGRAGSLILVFHDVTELKRLEAVRRDFTANVSHELRTPLTAIQGAAETLHGPASADPEAVRRFAAAITRHCRRLTSLVDDLLELGRIESKGERLQPREVSVRAAAEAALRVLDPLIKERRAKVSVEVPGEADRAWADPAALERILINLLQNAVSYSPEGSPVRVTARGDGEEVAVSVTDEGEGIPPEHLPRIFERFYRVDSSRSRERGGTGLGLAIVKHLVQGLGGGVEVESAPRKGSTFRFTLPRGA